MNYKDILVVTDDTPRCEEQVNVALKLAARHDAHVIGLMVQQPAHLPQYAPVGIPGALRDELLERQRQIAEEVRGRVREKFERLANAAGVPNEWHTADGDPVKAVSLFSRHADLAVIGQGSREHAGHGTARDLAEHVVLASGRPVLVVPRVGTYPSVGHRVLVAWDAGREAARAVADTLPLLKGAEHVVTLSANPDTGDKQHGELPGADIARHLARHGVRVDAQRVSSRDVPIADLLLNRILDERIDLLVMGAYGHARVREIWLGGVTRRLMESMTVPVFVSH
jgi:nucleotide-binding universal stress UspA family protein